MTLLIVIAAVFTACCAFAGASGVQSSASELITYGSAFVSRGAGDGEIKINFQTRGTGTISMVGVSRIVIYQSDETYVTTIHGSTANGLLSSYTSSHSGAYTYSGSPCVSYYAIMACYASNSSGYDTKTVTTNTVKAPY